MRQRVTPLESPIVTASTKRPPRISYATNPPIVRVRHEKIEHVQGVKSPRRQERLLTTSSREKSAGVGENGLDTCRHHTPQLCLRQDPALLRRQTRTARGSLWNPLLRP